MAQSPFGILRNKKDEIYSVDAFSRFAEIPASRRSKYDFASIDTAARGEEAKRSAVLGFGYLQAVLGTLHRIVAAMSFDPPGSRGRAEVLSASGDDAYDLSWNEEDEDYCQQGGLSHGPNFHAAVLALAQCVGMYLSGERIQSQELFLRWIGLLQAMEKRYPRLDQSQGWSRTEIAQACKQEEIRGPLLECCDSLRAFLQYRVATRSRREVRVFEEAVLEPEEGRSVQLSGEQLLDRALLLELAEAVPALPSPKPVSDEELTPVPPAKERKEMGPLLIPVGVVRAEDEATREPGAADGASPPAADILPATAAAIPVLIGAPAARAWKAARTDEGALVLLPSTDTSATAVAGVAHGTPAKRPVSPLASVIGRVPAAERSGWEGRPGAAAAEPIIPAATLRGPYVAQVDMAVAMGGTLLCTGPTGNGKTSLFLEHAIRYGWGVELVVLHYGKKSHMLQGTYVRSNTSGDYRFAAGPVARFAHRVLSGERVMLLLDELARAHESTFSFVMDLLNTYSSSEILTMRGRFESDSPEMRLALPDDFGASPGERYHIVTIDALHVRAVLPASRLRLVATANQGEGYEGHEFTDPAFCRRWYHWLHLPGYDDDVIRDILAERLAIKRTSPLINAMLQVDKEVARYHADEDALKFILCLPLLINWGEQTLWYVNHPSSKLRGRYREAFELAARNTWLNRVCPYKGGQLDEEVELKLLAKVRGTTLGSPTP
ncbi:MAG: AAA family ATPase [Streptosporangiaceae bacterium]